MSPALGSAEPDNCLIMSGRPIMMRIAPSTSKEIPERIMLSIRCKGVPTGRTENVVRSPPSGRRR